MPMPDDELRELFSQGRAADRASAPAFDETWAAAQQRRGSGLRTAVAIAVAAAILIAAGWLITRPDAPVPPSDEIAETNPQPDIPREDVPAPAVDDADELAALAAWEPALDSPTDFLLEEDGVLGGGMPSSDLSDSVLDLDELTMEL